MDLCLYAFVVQFPDDLLNDPSWISDRALLLPGGDGRRRESHDGYREYLSHEELLYMIALRLPKVENRERARLLYHRHFRQLISTTDPAPHYRLNEHERHIS